MRVRLIAGKYGGRWLDAPASGGTHPMGERIRNAMFNKVHHEIPGAKVLDAYAGTGAVGLEALSRGAGHVTFVESDRLAQKIITNNFERLGVDEEEVRLYRTRVKSFLGTAEPESFDLIFVDPPYYEIMTHFSTIDRLVGLLKPGALMVLSKPGKCEENVVSKDIVVVDNRSYSNATLTYYRKKG